MTEFWDRYTELTIRNLTSGTERTLTSDEFDIFFRTRRYMSGESAESYGATIDNTVLAEIGIFNLADDTIADIENECCVTRRGGSIVTLSSGYRDTIGVIFTGVVALMAMQHIGADTAIMLKCRESKYAVQNLHINKTYADVQTISSLVTKIANDAGVSISRVDPSTIRVGPRTYTPMVSVDQIFTKLAEEAGFRYEYKHGALYFIDPANHQRTLYDLTPQTGLLSMHLAREPLFVNDSYDVTTLLIPDIEWMGAVKIGDYICTVATKPVHTSNGHEHCTRFLAMVGEGVHQDFVFGGGATGGSGFGGSW